jgi:hypothetical protein
MKRAWRDISSEMSALTVPGLVGEIGAAIDRIIQREAGPNAVNVASRMQIDPKLLSECAKVAQEFIGENSSAAGVAHVKPSDLRSDPLGLIASVSGQIIATQSEMVVRNIVDEYTRMSKDAIEPPTPAKKETT